MKLNKCILTDLGSVNRGKSKHRPRNDESLFGGDYPFIQTGEVKSANFYLNSFSETYNEKGLAQSKLWEKGTLLITIAANIAETAILDIEACFPDSIIGFIPYENKSDVKFVKYYLDYIKRKLQVISQGTTQDNMSVEKLTSMPLFVPDYNIQVKIGKLLSNYDDLIENNNKRIKLLESMAEELYKEWFVRLRFPNYQNTKIEDGIPDGWEEKRIGQIFNTSSGGTPSRKNEKYYDGDNLWIKTGELKDIFILDTEEKISNEALVNSSAKLFDANTVIIAMYCAMPYISITIKPSSTNQACCAFIPKNDYLDYSFIYFFIKYAQIGMINYAHGAAQQNLSQEIISNYEVLFPSKELIVNYTKLVEPMFKEIKNLMLKTQTLKETRDLLLPRLLSGKLDIEKLDIN